MAFRGNKKIQDSTREEKYLPRVEDKWKKESKWLNMEHGLFDHN
jgi:hypothetical protein